MPACQYSFKLNPLPLPGFSSFFFTGWFCYRLPTWSQKCLLVFLDQTFFLFLDQTCWKLGFSSIFASKEGSASPSLWHGNDLFLIMHIEFIMDLQLKKAFWSTYLWKYTRVLVTVSLKSYSSLPLPTSWCPYGSPTHSLCINLITYQHYPCMHIC